MVRPLPLVALAALGVLGVAALGACSAASAPEPLGQSVAPLTWAFRAALTPAVALPGDEIGSAVALDGATALVAGSGVDGPSGANHGAAWVFTLSGGTWREQAFLSPPASRRFGSAAALSGDVAVIGAEIDTTSYEGAAYVFERAGTTWTAGPRLAHPAPQADDLCGAAVAVLGDLAVVGCPGDDIGPRGSQGSALVFRRSGTTWAYEVTLLASDGTTGHLLGWGVAITPGYVAVGAPQASQGSNATAGHVYVFERQAGAWYQTAILAPVTTFDSGLFGQTVAASGETLIGTARGVGTSAEGWVHTRVGTTWPVEATLVAANGPTSQAILPAPAALDADLAAVGGPSASNEQGLVTLFARSGTAWAEEARLGSPLGSGQERLGTAVALSGRTLLVGAPGLPAFGPTGTAYVFTGGGGAGQACLTGDDCAAGTCAGGVCCDRPCDGACEACTVAAGAAVDGVCAVVAAGSVGAPACAPLACDGIAAGCVACAADAACPAAAFCDASGRCVARRAPGAACDAAGCREAGCRQCDGACVDGRCCDGACDQPCQACAAALTGQADGTCAAVTVDTDPDDDCGPCALCDGSGQCAAVPADSDPRDRCAAGPGLPASCAADGLCDGAGQCRSYAPAGLPCGAGSCLGEALTAPRCDGAGACSSAATLSCAPFLCSAGACATSCAADGDCATGAFCDAAVCRPATRAGEACSRAGMCESGLCVDGVCCREACGGQCESCAEPGAEGTCVAVVGAPRGARAACPPAAPGAPCSAAECDGAARNTCGGYVGSSTVCRAASCSAGEALPEARCDGAGSCAALPAIACGAYQCGAEACLTACSADGDCAGSNRCVAGRCTVAATCTEDGAGVRSVDGTVEACAPYRCRGGACQGYCGATTDCAAGHVCTPDTQVCVATAPVAPDDPAGCACRAGSASPAGGQGGRAWWLGLALLGARATRRPWRAPSPRPCRR